MRAKYFALELCEGTLDDYCGGKFQGAMPTELNGRIQMAFGLSYLHISRIVEDGEYTRPPGARTDNFKAAELWRSRRLALDATSRQRIELSADIFALGCIFYFYLTRGSNPFGQEPLIAVKIINEESDLTGLSSDHFAIELIKEMVQSSSDSRPNAKEIVSKLIEVISPSTGFPRVKKISCESNGHVICCAYHPLVDRFACGVTDGKILIFDDNILIFTLECSTKAGVVKIGWNASGSLLAAGCSDGTVINFNENWTKVFEITAHKNRVSHLKWNLEGSEELLATCDQGGVLFWNSESLTDRFNFCGVRDTIWISEDQVCCCCDDGSVQILRKGHRTPLRTLNHQAFQLGLNQGGHILSCGEGIVKIWSLDGVEEIKSDHCRIQCFDVYFRRDNRNESLIACGNREPSVMVWNSEVDDPVTLAGICADFNQIKFSIDGKFLAAGDSEGYLFIWSTQDWKLIKIIETCTEFQFDWGIFSRKLAITSENVTFLELNVS